MYFLLATTFYTRDMHCFFFCLLDSYRNVNLLRLFFYAWVTHKDTNAMYFFQILFRHKPKNLIDFQ